MQKNPRDGDARKAGRHEEGSQALLFFSSFPPPRSILFHPRRTFRRVNYNFIFPFIDISIINSFSKNLLSQLELRIYSIRRKLLQFKKKKCQNIFQKSIDKSNKKYRLLHDLIKIPYEPEKSEPHRRIRGTQQCHPPSPPPKFSSSPSLLTRRVAEKERERNAVVPIPSPLGSFPPMAQQKYRLKF